MKHTTMSVMLQTALVALLLCALVGQSAPIVGGPERTPLSVRFVNGGTRALLLHWKRPNGELKKWGEFQPQQDQSVRSFSGETWVVRSHAARL